MDQEQIKSEIKRYLTQCSEEEQRKIKQLSEKEIKKMQQASRGYNSKEERVSNVDFILTIIIAALILSGISIVITKIFEILGGR